MAQLFRVARLLESYFGAGSGSVAAPGSTYNGLLLALAF